MHLTHNVKRKHMLLLCCGSLNVLGHARAEFPAFQALPAETWRSPLEFLSLIPVSVTQPLDALQQIRRSARASRCPGGVPARWCSITRSHVVRMRAPEGGETLRSSSETHACRVQEVACASVVDAVSNGAALLT